MLAESGPGVGRSLDQAIKISSAIEIAVICRHLKATPVTFVLKQLEDLRYIFHYQLWFEPEDGSPRVQGEMWFDITGHYDKYVDMFKQRAISAPYRGPDFCATCGAPNSKQKFLQCKKCKKRRYCDRQCQMVHWKSGHSKDCKKLREQKEWKVVDEKEAKEHAAKLEKEAKQDQPTSESREFTLSEDRDDQDPKIIHTPGDIAIDHETRLEHLKTETKRLDDEAKRILKEETQKAFLAEVYHYHHVRPDADKDTEDHVLLLYNTESWTQPVKRETVPVPVSDKQNPKQDEIKLTVTQQFLPRFRPITRSEYDQLKKEGAVPADGDFDRVLNAQKQWADAEAKQREMSKKYAEEVTQGQTGVSEEEDRITVLSDSTSDFKMSDTGSHTEGTWSFKPKYETYTRSEFEQLKKQGKISAKNDFDEMLQKQKAYLKEINETTADDTASTPLPLEVEPVALSETQTEHSP